jgi:hypothetical protein
VVVALALLAVSVLTGALATIFYRPYGADARAQLANGHWGLRVALASGLHQVHRFAALGLTAAAVAVMALSRPRQHVGLSRGRLIALGVALVAFLATGLVAPWERLLPWSPVVAANMARPMPLGQQGPFAELIGVNVRYDDAQFTVWKRRFGPKATGRVYFTHVLVLPALAVIGVAFSRRPRRRAPDRS